MTGFGFSGRYKLKKTDEFSSVFNFRRRISGAGLALYFMPTALGHARLGLVVAKKITRSAVHRNYMKRVLRELFRHARHDLGSIDLVIRPQKTFSSSDYAQIRSEFMQALERVRKRSGTSAA